MLILLIGLISLALAFTPEEVQIFQLQQEVKNKYGDKVDLYKLLKLPKLRESTSQDIRKNFRKLSKKYHPDKNKNYKKVYELINLATKILSDDSQRKTYDYYLKNGFPKYDFKKGGFYFSRVQPKTWFILAFIYVACGLIHYVLLKLQNDANKTRIERFLREVRAQDDTNGLGEKRLLFRQSIEDEGKEIIVRLGDVFAVQPDGSEAQITTEGLKNPGLADSALVSLPLWFWKKTLGRLASGKNDSKKSAPSTDKGTKKSTTAPKKSGMRARKEGDSLKLPNGQVVRPRKKAQ